MTVTSPIVESAVTTSLRTSSPDEPDFSFAITKTSMNSTVTFCKVETRLKRNWIPFIIVLAVLTIAYLAMARLPESYVAQLARSRPLERSQTDWAYRLLVFAAFGQAVYGGFVLLQTERIKNILSGEGRMSGGTRQRILDLVMRNAAVMVGLTFVYGVAAFFITGQRGGFWLFAFLSLVQTAWYLRQVNEIAKFLEFQQEPEPDTTEGEWKKPPPDYTPPIARGLVPSPSSQPH